MILFYDLIKIFIINSIYKYCIQTYRISFLRINLWLLCYNWWSSWLRIRFVGWFRIISTLILNKGCESKWQIGGIDVGDGCLRRNVLATFLSGLPPPSFNIAVKHQNSKDVSYIEILSPTPENSQHRSWTVSCAVSATSFANRASSTAVCGTIQQHQQQIKHLSNLRHKSGFFRL